MLSHIKLTGFPHTAVAELSSLRGRLSSVGQAQLCALLLEYEGITPSVGERSMHKFTSSNGRGPCKLATATFRRSPSQRVQATRAAGSAKVDCRQEVRALRLMVTVSRTCHTKMRQEGAKRSQTGRPSFRRVRARVSRAGQGNLDDYIPTSFHKYLTFLS